MAKTASRSVTILNYFNGSEQKDFDHEHGQASYHGG
jgi:hypothetical protein